MKKLLLITAAATVAALAVAAATKRPVRPPEQPAGAWELAPEHRSS